jgi:hypothetical protein
MGCVGVGAGVGVIEPERASTVHVPPCKVVKGGWLLEREEHRTYAPAMVGC